MAFGFFLPGPTGLMSKTHIAPEDLKQTDAPIPSMSHAADAEVLLYTPMTVFKKLANFNEILNFLNVFGLIETLVNFLMAY